MSGAATAIEQAARTRLRPLTRRSAPCSLLLQFDSWLEKNVRGRVLTLEQQTKAEEVIVSCESTIA